MLDNIDDINGQSPDRGAGTTTTVDTNWQNEKNHAGGFFGLVDDFMSAAVPIFVAAGGLYAAGSIGASVLGGGGVAAGATGAADAGATGLGSMAGADALGAGATAAGTAGAADAGIGALGSMIGTESIPAVVGVSGSAAGAGAGLGTLGTLGAGAAAAGTLGSMIGTESAPATVNVSAPSQPSTTSFNNVAPGIVPLTATDLAAQPSNSDLSVPPVVIPGVSMNAPDVPNLNIPMNPMPPISIPADTPATGSMLPSGSGLPSTSLPGGLTPKDILGGIGQIGSAITDYSKNTADQGYYQDLMNKMMGMYQPGTPEATLMEQKMNAQDAAAGRNSQYGVRATNLAGMLAQQRANIMTSPTFGKMADASRGHYDSSLNSLFNTLGSASTTGSALNNIVNAGSSWLGSLFSNSPAPTR